MALDTTKVPETIIVMLLLCWQISATKQYKASLPYVQTKLQSFSNWGYHNRKLESVCPRYKMPENHTWYAWFYTKCPLELSNFKVVLNSTSTTGFLLIEWSQCAWLSTFIFSIIAICYLDYPAQNLPVRKSNSALFEWHSCY